MQVLWKRRSRVPRPRYRRNRLAVQPLSLRIFSFGIEDGRLRMGEPRFIARLRAEWPPKGFLVQNGKLCERRLGRLQLTDDGKKNGRLRINSELLGAVIVRDRFDRLLAILEMARVAANPQLRLGELVEDFVDLQRAPGAPVLHGLGQVVDRLPGVKGGEPPPEIELGEGGAIGRVRWLRCGLVARG